MATTPTTLSATTSGSPDRLWALVGDLERWGDLLPTMTSVRRLDGDAATSVGSRFEVRQPGLPRAVWQVTAWAPGRSFTWVSRTPGVLSTATHEVVPDGDGARILLDLDWTGPLARPVRLLLGARARRMVRTEADTFARLAAE